MPVKEKRKPSTLLGFLLGGMIVAFIAFCIWQIGLDAKSKYLLLIPQWVVVFAAMTAMCGWIIASIITIRNSVKQHTINTLLQSRLSATYMSYADKISKHYVEHAVRKKADPELEEQPTDGVDKLALNYILNYFEFIAIGIKRGDLDEPMLKDSLRSIIRANVDISRPWIEARRAGNSAIYEHLMWLYERWAPKESSAQ